MKTLTDRLQEFINYASKLKGDEKSEAQLFCDRFFRAFGHGGIIEANGKLEARIKFSTGGTKFADCLWAPPGRDGVLIEMKKKQEKNLAAHFMQLRNYWIEMNPETVIGPSSQKPKYMILCNFERFLVYKQLSLVDDIPLDKLLNRASAFNFMLQEEREPIFKHNVEAISQDAAKTLGELFKHLVHDRKEDREVVQRYVFQSVLALFSEDFSLLPNDFFSEIIRDCQRSQSAYDLIGGLFHQMASEKRAKGGRYKNIAYFNGGLFDTVEPLELDEYSINLLDKAAEYNWRNVNPAIFGSLFESTLSKKERHAYGAHFTSETDILKIVNPTIIRPWKQRIQKAKTLTELRQLHSELSNFTVFDPACGCGNFLYVAYHALKDIEMQLIETIANNFTKRAISSLNLGHSRITTQQFRGIDILPIAVEVAKMTMMVAKELAADVWNHRISTLMATLNLDFDEGLPLDRLDKYIVQGDALFDEWPRFDAVISNPPYQSKNKMQEEMDTAYIAKVRARYPEVPGRADYCVYWFRHTHEQLKTGQRAGLVGTNTIRQNYSRQGGLDYIVSEGGIISEAVSSQVWSGEAVVHVSIVNWVKGDEPGKKQLSVQVGDNIQDPFEFYEMEKINSSLSPGFDVTQARDIAANANSQACYQGQTHGHEGFLITKQEYEKLKQHHIYPYLIGRELLCNPDSLPSRYVIDLNHADDVFSAQGHKELYGILRERVYPYMKKKSEVEKKRTGKDTGPRQSHFNKWWKFWRSRDEMMQILLKIKRYIVCSRVTKRPIFEFIDSSIHPNDALQVFPLDDDYSFGILQSSMHWEWFCAKCSTLKRDWRYTSNTVFKSFPWPQAVKFKDVRVVAQSAIALRRLRRQIMLKHGWSLRDLYRAMEETPDNPISHAQDELDRAVRQAYGIKRNEDVLPFLFQLNQQLYSMEQHKKRIQGPGLPQIVGNKNEFITADCVSISEYLYK